MGLIIFFFSVPSLSLSSPPLSLSKCLFLDVPCLWASVPFSQGTPPHTPRSDPQPGRDSRLRHYGELQKWGPSCRPRRWCPHSPDLGLSQDPNPGNDPRAALKPLMGPTRAKERPGHHLSMPQILVCPRQKRATLRPPHPSFPLSDCSHTGDQVTKSAF